MQLIDTVMSPNAQLRALNPHMGVAVRRKTAPLLARFATPMGEAQCSGGVNSFGYSGTITHAVLHTSSMVYSRAHRLVYRRHSFSWRATGWQANTSLTALHATCWMRPLSPDPPDAALFGPHLLVIMRDTTLVPSRLPMLWLLPQVLVVSLTMSESLLVYGIHSTLTIVQQLAGIPVVGRQSPPRVILVTCNVQSSTRSQSASNAAGGGVWGLARVVRLELASLRVRTTDVSHDASEVSATALLGPPMEVEEAWRESTRCTPRLRACSAIMSGELTHGHGVHVIKSLHVIVFHARRVALQRGFARPLPRASRAPGGGGARARARLMLT
jgi:hypothetical protein